jgi:hypothetical protein
MRWRQTIDGHPRGRNIPVSAVLARGKTQQHFDPPAWRLPLKGVAALVTIKQLAGQE